MIEEGKIPVIVGVTGHRNIAAEDRDELKKQITAALGEIKRACTPDKGEDTPVVMLNAFAQGADMLCAEAAFDMGIDVYAVLPCRQDEYIDSFTEVSDREKLYAYLERAKRVIIAPDFEGNSEWLGKEFHMSGRDYEYRQTGIYIAEYSHLLIALWDGKSPKEKFGCGTAEVIKFALEHEFLDDDRVFSPGTMNDSAVLWINARRTGGDKQDITRRWLVSNFANECGAKPYGDYCVCDAMPQYLSDIIASTVKYNSQTVQNVRGRLWEREEELDEYRRNLSRHYAKADSLSFDGNQKYYNLFILLIAIVGTFVAFSFMLYDDASLTFMILPCILAVGGLIWIIRRGSSRGYHEKYIEYRAVAEAFRIQFYMSLCLMERQILSNVCRLYSWTQKVNSVWIYKALQAVAVISDVEPPEIDASRIMSVWIGNSKTPQGQLKYHEEKLVRNREKAAKYTRISKALTIVTVGVYAVIFIMEAIGHILGAFGVSWFWDDIFFGGVSWRSVGVILMGTATAASLLFSSYFGKLSFDRKADDNRKMSMFYASAWARWQEAKMRPSVETNKFIKEIAREEIVENGIWCSYVKDNSLEINI